MLALSLFFLIITISKILFDVLLHQQSPLETSTETACQTNTFHTTETENDYQLTGFGFSYGNQATAQSSGHSLRRSLRSQR